ncbi:DUF6596 domain-containing protein [Hamadaea sp.]|uniref:DUF6596 domain-containing protein n=1 Tax=Hamadaea sp. TaxID=2024425 RepID=UPI00341C10C0
MARALAALQPDEPEAHGLVALFGLTAARFAARTADDGSPILLADQSPRSPPRTPRRARWRRPTGTGLGPRPSSVHRGRASRFGSAPRFPFTSNGTRRAAGEAAELG